MCLAEGGGEDVGPRSSGLTSVPRARSKSEAPRPTHPSRTEAGLADGRPAVGVAVVWRTQARPPPARGTKPAATKERPTPVSLGAAAAFLQKRLQLPTVTGIKLRGPDGGFCEPGRRGVGGDGGGGRRRSGAGG